MDFQFGTLVIESAYRSGTSITAGLAINQGKKVFCVPHSLGTKTGVGNNRLIQQGAKLVVSTEDILEELKIIQNSEVKEENDENIEVAEEYKKVYENLTTCL